MKLKKITQVKKARYKKPQHSMYVKYPQKSNLHTERLLHGARNRDYLQTDMRDFTEETRCPKNDLWRWLYQLVKITGYTLEMGNSYDT